VSDEERFWLNQHCDGQGAYETPAPYDVPTPAEQFAAELAHDARGRAARHAAAAARELANPTHRECPGRARLFAGAGGLRALAVALAAHDAACGPCGEELAGDEELARALLAAGAGDAEVA